MELNLLINHPKGLTGSSFTWKHDKDPFFFSHSCPSYESSPWEATRLGLNGVVQPLGCNSHLNVTNKLFGNLNIDKLLMWSLLEIMLGWPLNATVRAEINQWAMSAGDRMHGARHRIWLGPLFTSRLYTLPSSSHFFFILTAFHLLMGQSRWARDSAVGEGAGCRVHSNSKFVVRIPPTPTKPSKVPGEW